MEDIRAQLLVAFAGELDDHLAAIRAALAAAEAGGAADLRDIFRRAHSLKGAARAVEQPATEALAHDLETLLAAVEQGEATLDAATIAEVRRQLDAIEDAGRGAPAAAEEAPHAAEDGLRVQSRHVEALIGTIAVIAGSAPRRTALGAAVAALEGELRAIADLVAAGDKAEAERRLRRTASETARLRRDEARLAWDIDRTIAALERGAERLMLAPARSIADGFERMVRDLAESQGKAAALQLTGPATDADRRVLQALREPVMHLLRNAVSHGIEPIAIREQAGKPARGAVALDIRARRGQLVVTVSDDGAGVDLARIEAAARRAGAIAADAPTPPSEALLALAFEQGLSTAEEVDAVSGRGVGLSVVADAARRLYGHVTLAAGVGGGAEARLSVPLAVARRSVLLFDCAGATWALPSAAVGAVLRVEPGAIIRSDGGTALLLMDQTVPVVPLASLLGLADAAPAGPRPAIVLRIGTTRVAILVDALNEVRTAVIGDPRAIAVDAPLVFGTCLIEDGVALVLSARTLMARARHRRGMLPASPPPAAARRRTVLVVDDSITTRTLEKSILEAQGYAVLISVDGLDGLERLRERPDVDLIVADVEMPRMDGFALLAAIRNDPTLANIPVVMMTSRNSPDDVERGLALGANAYVTKQDFDQGELLAIIGQLI